MNAVTGLVAIVSLLLALAGAGGAATEQAGADSQAARPVTTSKLGANHNETLVSDATPVEQAALSRFDEYTGARFSTCAGCPI